MNNENFAKLLDESFSDINLKPGTLIKGRVVSIDKEYVIVDVGLKSEGAIPKSQFFNREGTLTVAVDDEVEVALEMIEDGYGETRLSRDKAKRVQAWRKLQEIYDNQGKVEGVITSYIKGGFAVDILGLKAFLPGSLVDMRPVQNPSTLEGKMLEFKLIKMDSERNNIVVSRRALLEEAISEERSELLSKIQDGDEIDGVVKNLVDYGAFIDLGGMDGLLHITDMSWKRINHPGQLVEVGQKVHVVVLKVDREHNRVSLGIKQLSHNPWENVNEHYPIGDRIKGTVTNITDYGCFVELEEGIEGLVHVSQMDWRSKNIQPSKILSLGQSVEVVVLEVDGGRHRISLGMKQCKDNPWKEFAEIYKKGQRLTGPIKSITDFGLFVGLPGDIDGLVHVSDIAWDSSEAEHQLKEFVKGDDIEVVVLAIEANRERISLGIKQLHEDPFSNYLKIYEKGHIVKATIVTATNKGIKLELDEGVDGYIKSFEMSRTLSASESAKKYHSGDTIEAKIVGADYKNREVQLSIKAIEQDDTKALKDLNKNMKITTKTTLGDLIKAKQNQSDHRK